MSLVLGIVSLVLGFVFWVLGFVFFAAPIMTLCPRITQVAALRSKEAANSQTIAEVLKQRDDLAQRLGSLLTFP